MKLFQKSLAAVGSVFINRYHGRLHRLEDALTIVMNAVAFMQKEKKNNGSFEFGIIHNIVLKTISPIALHTVICNMQYTVHHP